MVTCQFPAPEGAGALACGIAAVAEPGPGSGQWKLQAGVGSGWKSPFAELFNGYTCLV